VALCGSLARVAEFGSVVKAAEIIFGGASAVLVKVCNFVLDTSLVLHCGAVLALDLIVREASFAVVFEERVKVTGVIAACLALENSIHTVTTGYSEAATGGRECVEHLHTVGAAVGFLEDFLVATFPDGLHVGAERRFLLANLAVGNDIPTVFLELVGLHVTSGRSFDDVSARGFASGGAGLGVGVTSGAALTVTAICRGDFVAIHAGGASIAKVLFRAGVLVTVFAELACRRGFGSVDAACGFFFGILVRSGFTSGAVLAGFGPLYVGELAGGAIVASITASFGSKTALGALIAGGVTSRGVLALGALLAVARVNRLGTSLFGSTNGTSVAGIASIAPLGTSCVFVAALGAPVARVSTSLGLEHTSGASVASLSTTNKVVAASVRSSTAVNFCFHFEPLTRNIGPISFRTVHALITLTYSALLASRGIEACRCARIGGTVRASIASGTGLHVFAVKAVMIAYK
jgi:hypothetical protein